MRAAVLEQPGRPLVLKEMSVAEPGAGQLRIRVEACGVCRTDLHIVDGELDDPKLPLVLGHQIVGVVDALGGGVTDVAEGERIGVPWLGWTCGECRFCRGGRENLCDRARFTGYHVDGGFAEAAIADARYCFRIPDGYPSLQAAPLLCAGLISYRALRLTGDAERLGLYGFGAAAHVIAQVARWEGRRVFAFTRRGDEAGQEFARSLGVEWAGGAEEEPPDELDAAIIFAPAGELVPVALRALAKGGIVVCAGIHMSDIPSFPYELLWGERSVRSVANLTRADGVEFLQIAPRVPVQTHVEPFALADTNAALDRLRAGTIRGAAVISINAASGDGVDYAVNGAMTGFTADEAKRIGEQIGIDWSSAPFDVEQFRLGMEVELEHGSRDPRTNVTDDDPLVTGKIALAHLNEFSDYYTRLERMEEDAKRDHGNGGTPPGRSGHA